MLLVRLTLLALFLPLGSWLIFSAIRAIWFGEANAGGARVRYRLRPAFFISAVIAQFGFGVLMLYFVFNIFFALIGR